MYPTVCTSVDSPAVLVTVPPRSTISVRASGNAAFCPRPSSTTHRYGAPIGATITPIHPAAMQATKPHTNARWSRARAAIDGHSERGDQPDDERDAEQQSRVGGARPVGVEDAREPGERRVEARRLDREEQRDRPRDLVVEERPGAVHLIAGRGADATGARELRGPHDHRDRRGNGPDRESRSPAAAEGIGDRHRHARRQRREPDQRGAVDPGDDPDSLGEVRAHQDRQQHVRDRDRGAGDRGTDEQEGEPGQRIGRGARTGARRARRRWPTATRTAGPAPGRGARARRSRTPAAPPGCRRRRRTGRCRT